MDMKKGLIASVLVVGILSVSGIAVFASDDDDDEDDNPAALAQALPQASVSLEQGLKASEREGKPISAKFELEHGALQLSVYTANGNAFKEVIVDHKSSGIKKVEAITEGDDLKAAKQQALVLAKAKSSLDQATQNALKANAGYRAVSVIPQFSGGQPVAAITLMKGTEVKKDLEKL